MPELPEVETTVRDLKRTKPKILNSSFLDVWADAKKIIKKPRNFQQFRKELSNKKILNIWRRGKNIVFTLSGRKYLLIHQKLTGHLLYGKWKKENNKWVPDVNKPQLREPPNRYLHLIFFLDNGYQIALSDLRKFAKVKILDEEELKKEISKIGPEPLNEKFSFKTFKEILSKKKKGRIKQILMDQKIIAGIGNIYSDEILWKARIYPLRDIPKITDEGLRRIFKAMKEILSKAVQLGGESISDFRRISGEKGSFDKMRRVYRKEGEKCQRCGTLIKKIKIGSRSSYFCPKCQK
jgi:formamidopyrimidine-DNA glycosylase